MIVKKRKTKEAEDKGSVRKGAREKNEEERGKGDRWGWFQVFAESAGAGAINLAGISELMNVIKIQPPAS